MLNGKRFTTINTDAGVKDGFSAVAWWIRSDNKWLTGSQALKTPNLNPNEAELAGIVIALTHASNDPFLSTADVIVVNCDSQVALKMIKELRFPDKYRPFVETVHSIIPKEKIKYKWIKGHTKKGQSKHWVNNWCDKEVRKHYKQRNTGVTESTLGTVPAPTT